MNFTASAALVPAVAPTANQRWDDWRARGRAHDLRVRRRWADLGLMLVVLSGLVLASLADLL
jgi:hypothetical protein